MSAAGSKTSLGTKIARLAAGALVIGLVYLGARSDDSDRQDSALEPTDTPHDTRSQSRAVDPVPDQHGHSEAAPEEPTSDPELHSSAVAPTPEPDPPTREAAAEPAAGELATMADELVASGYDKLASGDLEGSLIAFTSAVELYPSAKTHGALGWLYYRMNVTSQMHVELGKAAELDPFNADRWIALANAQFKRTRHGEAWKALERAREVEPGIDIDRGADGIYRRGDDTPADATARLAAGTRTGGDTP